MAVDPAVLAIISQARADARRYIELENQRSRARSVLNNPTTAIDSLQDAIADALSLLPSAKRHTLSPTVAAQPRKQHKTYPPQARAPDMRQRLAHFNTQTLSAPTLEYPNTQQPSQRLQAALSRLHTRATQLSSPTIPLLDEKESNASDPQPLNAVRGADMSCNTNQHDGSNSPTLATPKQKHLASQSLSLLTSVKLSSPPVSPKDQVAPAVTTIETERRRVTRRIAAHYRRSLRVKMVRRCMQAWMEQTRLRALIVKRLTVRRSTMALAQCFRRWRHIYQDCLVAKAIEAERRAALQQERQQAMVKQHYTRQLLRRLFSAWRLTSQTQAMDKLRAQMLQAQQAQLLLRLQRHAQPTDSKSTEGPLEQPPSLSSSIPLPKTSPKSRIPKLMSGPRARAGSDSLPCTEPPLPVATPATTKAYEAILETAAASKDQPSRVLSNMSARAHRRETLKQQRLARLVQKEQAAEAERAIQDQELRKTRAELARQHRVELEQRQQAAAAKRQKHAEQQAHLERQLVSAGQFNQQQCVKIYGFTPWKLWWTKQQHAKTTAIAHCHSHLVISCWKIWRKAREHRETQRLAAANALQLKHVKCRALAHWRAVLRNQQQQQALACRHAHYSRLRLAFGAFRNVLAAERSEHDLLERFARQAERRSCLRWSLRRWRLALPWQRQKEQTMRWRMKLQQAAREVLHDFQLGQLEEEV
eukprot:m.160262 g.160262  ORF g.160262 m.160262 type:complete len:703 (-) comp16498_c0_seq4:43-2151(-)